MRRKSAVERWLATLLLFAAGCTHLTPYYRGGTKVEVSAADSVRIDHRLLLIGDAGDPAGEGEPALQLLARRVRSLPERTTVVFLGDNIYERGMPKVEKPKPPAAAAAEKVVDATLLDDRREAERAIEAQIAVVRGTAARAIFVPGNHDWDQSDDGGWDRLLAQEEYLLAAADAGGAHVAMLPSGGCPGPAPLPLGRSGELIALDTQWWLASANDDKPTVDNPAHCPFVTEESVRRALLTQLETAAEDKRWSIVVGHHPLASAGPHGGFNDARTHLFPFRAAGPYVPFYIEWIPLPLFGSLFVGVRACCSPSEQDLSNDRNQHLRDALASSLLEAQRQHAAPVAYAAGHDHSLQVFESEGGPRYLLVSGLGSSSHATDVGDERRTLFAHSDPDQTGFMQVDFLADGGVRLGVLEWSAEKPEGIEVFSRYLVEPGLAPGERRTADGG